MSKHEAETGIVGTHTEGLCSHGSAEVRIVVAKTRKGLAEKIKCACNRRSAEIFWQQSVVAAFAVNVGSGTGATNSDRGFICLCLTPTAKPTEQGPDDGATFGLNEVFASAPILDFELLLSSISQRVT